MANRKIRQEMSLSQLRAHLGYTQTEIADKMKMAQPSISKIEGQTNNTMIQTLKRYIEAMGGTLEISAGFSDSKYIIEFPDSWTRK